jgi:GNAT superfamily N-acetyltransferase
MARRIRPLTFERTRELPAACAYCRFWESGAVMAHRCGANCDEAAAAAWFEAVHAEWGDPGRVAYADKEALGFVKYAPARYFGRPALLPAGRPSDDAVLLSCLHVRDDARNLGLGTLLVHAALSDLVSRGEKAVEAYGTVAPVTDETPFISVNFLLRQGFAVTRPHPDLPLMRLELKALASWTETLESALDALQIRLKPTPAGVPSAFSGPQGR